MTVERGQATLSPDPEASLRTELIGQLASAQLALEAAMSELSRSGTDATTLSELRGQITSIIDLRQHVGNATGADLASLRREVTSAAAASQALTQQAVNGKGGESKHTPMTHQQARATIQSVGHDLFDRHVLDPYLQFASEEDEKTYRKREQENAEALKRALALRTPEGDRRALEITRSQLADAKAHGADRSPDFPAMENKLDNALAALDANQERKVAPPAKATRTTDTTNSDDISEAVAALQAAGVKLKGQPEHRSGHGLVARTNIAQQDSAPARV